MGRTAFSAILGFRTQSHRNEMNCKDGDVGLGEQAGGVA